MTAQTVTFSSDMKKDKLAIIAELQWSCLENNPKSFIPFLLSENVKTNMPDKFRFYSFFKSMVKSARENSIGEWTLKIENWDIEDHSNTLAYNFYDEVHKYARLTIMVRETENELHLDTLPF